MHLNSVQACLITGSVGLLGVCVTEDQVSVLVMTRPGFTNYCVAQQEEEDVPGAELVPDALQYLK